MNCCSHRAPKLRRFHALSKWILPGGILVLMPKCPLCLAAYIAVWTSVGLSLTAVSYLRWTLLFLSAGMLAVVVVGTVRRFSIAGRLFTAETPRRGEDSMLQADSN